MLGKIIGIYLGRPFEGWTYERIWEELGEIVSRPEWMVNFGLPRVNEVEPLSGGGVAYIIDRDHISSQGMTVKPISE